jgi:hypothetical protein
MNDVWSLDLRDARLAAALRRRRCASGRYGHSATFDPDRREMVVFGGANVSVFLPPADSWTISTCSRSMARRPGRTSRARRDPRRATSTPPCTTGHAGGSCCSAGTPGPNTTTSGRWTRARVRGPVSVRRHAGAGSEARDVRRHRCEQPAHGAVRRLGQRVFRRHVDARAWTSRHRNGPRIRPPGPSARSSTPPRTTRRATACCCSAARIRTSSSTTSGKLDLTGEPVWSPLATAGTPPSRRECRAVYDPVRDRLLLFGRVQLAVPPRRDVGADAVRHADLAPALIRPAHFRPRAGARR